MDGAGDAMGWLSAAVSWILSFDFVKIVAIYFVISAAFWLKHIAGAVSVIVQRMPDIGDEYRAKEGWENVASIAYEASKIPDVCSSLLEIEEHLRMIRLTMEHTQTDATKGLDALKMDLFEIRLELERLASAAERVSR